MNKENANSEIQRWDPQERDPQDREPPQKETRYKGKEVGRIQLWDPVLEEKKRQKKRWIHEDHMAARKNTAKRQRWKRTQKNS